MKEVIQSINKSSCRVQKWYQSTRNSWEGRSKQPDNMGEKGPEANAVVHAPGNKVHRNQHLLCLSFGWLYAWTWTPGVQEVWPSSLQERIDHGASWGYQSISENSWVQEEAYWRSPTQCWPPFSRKARRQEPPLYMLSVDCRPGIKAYRHKF